ncbi:MAG: hypothetical protein HKN54_08230 [Flavobacteriaceae bacterium]|nr:hypothetical protein [Flavobacteriaceae bacterium]
MNTSDFTGILIHPEDINASQIADVKSVIEEFPYFQSARAIYLKGLKDTQSFKYNQELKTTAAYTTDRSVLFDFITTDQFIQNKISEQIKRNQENLKDIEIFDVEDLSVSKSVRIDAQLKQHMKDAEPIVDPHLFHRKYEEAKTEEPFQIEADQILEKSPEETLEIGKPLEFDRTEMHSFSEWLKITSFKPINREDQNQADTKEKSQDPQTKKSALIDRFIESNPKIQPIRSEGPTHNIAKSQMMQPDSLMTETLARIYLEQKNYDKAIQAYKVLSLKYPEKSGFFADQIQAIKELKNQNKSK